MGKVFAYISMSLDGYVAGPKPDLKEPLGIGGEQLHEWIFKLKSWRKPHGLAGGEEGSDNDIASEAINRTGAVIMGRKMFSGGEGPWGKDPKADGWWGANPPFHCPVFVLTHHARDKVIKQGGTTFTFVTDGIESTLSQAKAAAKGKDISVGGGAEAIQEFIKAGFLDELQVHVVPILLGGGTPLFDNLEGIELEKISVIDSPGVTHFKFKPKK